MLCLLRQTNYVLIIDTFSRPIRPLYIYIYILMMYLKFVHGKESCGPLGRRNEDIGCMFKKSLARCSRPKGSNGVKIHLVEKQFTKPNKKQNLLQDVQGKKNLMMSKFMNFNQPFTKTNLKNIWHVVGRAMALNRLQALELFLEKCAPLSNFKDILQQQCLQVVKELENLEKMEFGAGAPLLACVQQNTIWTAEQKELLCQAIHAKVKQSMFGKTLAAQIPMQHLQRFPVYLMDADW